MFIDKLRDRFEVESIVLKGIEFDNFIPMGNSGIVVEYIDLDVINEDNGYDRNYLLDRNLLIRQNGLQAFQLFSDVWNDIHIHEDAIFDKINQILVAIDSDTQSTGRNPMIDYMTYDLISKAILEPSWSVVDLSASNKQYITVFDKVVVLDDIKTDLIEIKGDIAIYKNITKELEEITDIKDLDTCNTIEFQDVIYKEIISEEFIECPIKNYFTKRVIPKSQNLLKFLNEKKENSNLTRVYDCGLI